MRVLLFGGGMCRDEKLAQLKPHVGPTSSPLELAWGCHSMFLFHSRLLLGAKCYLVGLLTFHALLLLTPSSRPREWRPGFPLGPGRIPWPVLCVLPKAELNTFTAFR